LASEQAIRSSEPSRARSENARREEAPRRRVDATAAYVSVFLPLSALCAKRGREFTADPVYPDS